MQIRMFYPELDHPAFGVVRAIVKDNTDTETGPSAAVFLDSDNLVSLPHPCLELRWSQSWPTTVTVIAQGMQRCQHSDRTRC